MRGHVVAAASLWGHLGAGPHRCGAPPGPALRAGAGLDIFDHEPLADDHPPRTLPNVLVLPHLGHVTRRSDEGCFRHPVEDDVTAFLAGSPIRQLG
ncbi:NAD(P)-dependent oxidoreductase [Streptomyces sp. NPDC048637]|uniref:NAD(P)-dependent oxidoreductase n=1 Tax=Streptomyces sp. NPDC048637 TaxID=3155636 RepID=UPI00342393BE